MNVPSPVTAPASDHLYEYRDSHAFTPGGSKARFLAAALPCLTGLGCAYQAIAAAWDRSSYPHPGELVEVDGRRLHVCNSGVGSPTVVMESGLGGMSSGWAWIQPEVAKFTRTFSYDRAGLGWSEADHRPPYPSTVSARLHNLLDRCKVPPPYVLVGHSLGGMYMRKFASLYPHEVAGLVLIDAAHPDQHRRSRAIDTHMRTGFRMLKHVPLLTRLGYIRLSRFFDEWAEGLPTRQAAEARMFLCSHRHLTATFNESLAWGTICAEVRQTGGIGSKPLAVLSAGKDVLPGHPELQAELTGLSTNSTHTVVRGADHVTLVTQRQHALTVVQAIRRIVDAVKFAQP